MATKKKQKLPEGVRLLASGRYQARYPVVENGVRRLVPVGQTFASARDAADARAFELAKIRTGTWVDPLGPKTTVEAWAKEWQSLRRGGNTKTASFLRSRIVPWWGERKIGEITPLDVQRWINLLIDDGLSPATIGGLYATFRQMMQHAVDHDLLGRTPCRNITLPVQRRPDPVPLDVASLLLLEANAPDRYRAMIHLSAWAGLRWQEAAALRWEHVDLENGLIRICQAIKADGTIGETKNRKDRVVPVGDTTIEVLRTHRRDFGQHELLFVGARHARPLQYANFRKAVWLPLVLACELEPAPTYHDLRHAHAAHMTRMGMYPDVLSDRLGHHKPSFTADRYGWRRQDFREVSVAAIEAAMRGE